MSFTKTNVCFMQFPLIALSETIVKEILSLSTRWLENPWTVAFALHEDFVVELDVTLYQRPGEVSLALEVVEETALGYPGLTDDLLQGHGGNTVTQYQPLGDIHQPVFRGLTLVSHFFSYPGKCVPLVLSEFRSSIPVFLAVSAAPDPFRATTRARARDKPRVAPL